MPKISVVMPTYNAEKFLRESVDSILSQTYRDFELLIIDDNSKDHTREIINSYKDERIKLINGDCKGLPAALNKGILAAKGEYIARMDADDISLPERFEEQVNFLDKHPDISLVGSWQKYIGFDSSTHKPLQFPEQVKVSMLFGCELCHSTVMFRKNDFVSNNLFYDENSKQEDFELWSRAVQVLKFANIQKILGLYRVTGCSITDQKKDCIENCGIEIVKRQLKDYLHIDIDDKDQELIVRWSSPLKNKNKEEKKDFFKRLENLYRLIEKQNSKYNIYDPELLHSYLCLSWARNCRGKYFIYRSEYLKINFEIFIDILKKTTKTNVCFSPNFSVIQILGMRFYKKSILNNEIVRKYLGIWATKRPFYKKKKCLIIRFGAIGDVVHTTIMPQAIKAKHPDVEIHYLTASHIVNLLKFSPYIDKVLSFDEKKKDNIFYLLYKGFSLRRERYDISFNLTNAFRNILIDILAGAKKRVKRNPNRVHAVDAFFNTAKDAFQDLEEPDHIVLVPDKKSLDFCSGLIKGKKRPFFIFNPGGANDCERQGRIWPDEYWIELGNKLVEKYGGTVFVCGSKSEKESHQKFSAIKNSLIVSGELTLEQSAALYSLSDLFVSGDSGPLHVASALDIDVIGIYGACNPSYCSPYSKRGHCIEPLGDCIYCGKRVCKKLIAGERFTPCIRTVTPERVLECAKSILSKLEVE